MFDVRRFPIASRRVGDRHSNPAPLPWLDGLPARRCSLLHPLPILPVSWIGDDKSVVRFLRAAYPMVGFRMPVRKGKAAAAVVVCPGSIKPLCCFYPEGKSGVVEAIDIFVQQHPEHGRSRGADIGHFAISGPRRIPVVSMLVVQPGAVDRQIWGAAVIVVGAGKSVASKPGSIVPTAWLMEKVLAAGTVWPINAGSVP